LHRHRRAAEQRLTTRSANHLTHASIDREQPQLDIVHFKLFADLFEDVHGSQIDRRRGTRANPTILTGVGFNSIAASSRSLTSRAFASNNPASTRNSRIPSQTSPFWFVVLATKAARSGEQQWAAVWGQDARLSDNRNDASTPMMIPSIMPNTTTPLWSLLPPGSPQHRGGRGFPTSPQP
jgi:hypothetical protein